ncbi:MAG: phage integrase N-terminal SAM-like domain-containing protein [Bacteroidota bacterium]
MGKKRGGILPASKQREGSSDSGQSKPRLFKVLQDELQLRNYSYKTIKAYRSCLRSFVRHFAPRHPRELTERDIRGYLLARKDGSTSLSEVYRQCLSELLKQSEFERKFLFIV